MSTDICRWLFLLFFLTTWTKSNSKEIRVVCYYTNWSVYRPGTAKFSPQNINPYLCTHLIYAFGGFTKENTLKPFDKYQDIEKGGYAKFTGLKTYNKNLKTMLAIGGWNEGSSRFSPMVANPERRKELIRNAVKFLRQNHFDGLDLDWEYPSFRDGGKSRDRDNYAQLVQELREEFERESEKTGRSRLLLTMAVPAGIEYINKGYDVPKLTKYLDWMNILSYDYHSAFEPAVNHHAPLYPLEEPSEYNYDTELNIDYTIQHYMKKGADPSKLVLGIPTYGRSYTLYNPDANEIGAPADGPGDMGDATRENGYLAYYEICENIKSQDWEEVQPNEDAMGPYAFKDNQWVGYDDAAIARKKAAYVAENGLGGIMFWSIDNDDFRGNCYGKPYPIIEAAKEALISAYGLTDENLVSPPAKPAKTKSRTRQQSTSKASSSDDSDKKRLTSSGSSRRRNRVKSKPDETTSSSRAKIRRKESRRTTEGPVYSSLELVTPSYTTPAPPSTPDQGGGFKCEDEGFYPHPKDCKKYYWCLSGPGELGIVAHQFTCPAGLYFNKAADSCDYTRNVLCNKKFNKATTTTTTTEQSTSKTTPTSTVRVPPKITAATSRTTVFRTSTTTQAYEDEYEYEDEDDFEESKNSEEDPKVIKELLDLIKKAGGIEELEKQLKIHEDGSASVSNADATTPSSISKSLVERVLGKAAKSNIGGRKNPYSFLNRNSRGPQNEGIKTTEDKKETNERGRPQYTTITRQRPQKTEDQDDDSSEKNEDEDNSDKTSKKSTKKQPEYVNIRRGRVSTTEEPEEDTNDRFNRNKVLGEEDESEIDNDDDEEPLKKKNAAPQYVNIRRQRPSTTEESSTSKYTVIRRGTTTEPDTEEDNSESKTRGSSTPSAEDATSGSRRRGTTTESSDLQSSTQKIDLKSKYKTLRRGSTTESSVDETGSTSSSKRRGSTLPSVQDVSENSKTRGSTVASITSTTLNGENDLKSKYRGTKRASTTEASTTENKKASDGSTLKSSTASQISSTTHDVTTNSETEDPTTTLEQLLTSPESLTITTASLTSTTSGSKLSNTSESAGEGVYKKTQPPLLLEPRPFSLSTSSPTSSLKPVTESSTRITKVSDPNYKLRLRQKLQNTQTDIISTTILTTEKPTPFRTRAPSRYKPPTVSIDQEAIKPVTTASVRARKRFSTTTELFLDNYEEYDLNRTYRPSGIADLSSLTAVDFTSLKGLGFNSQSRQRRPRPSTTTTEKTEETLKTSSRTLPLARKLLEGSSFGKSKRVLPNKTESVLEDQIKSSSDTTHRVRGFTRVPSNFSSVSTTEASTRHTLRNRKIIRRLRPTVSSKVAPQASNDSSLDVVPFRKRLVRPSSTVATETENLIENASSNSLFNRRFNRPRTTTTEAVKTSSSTEKEKVTTTEGLQKVTTHLPTEDDVQNETSEDVSGEEGENIKLSESNIRENSNVNNNNVVAGDEGKKVKRKILKRVRSKVDEEKSATEPNVIIRTRKIIRKLKPTESTLLTTTTESVEVTTQGRKRKIIRRLRPTSTTIASSESSEATPTEKTLYIRGRPFTTPTNQKSEDEKETEEKESEIDPLLEKSEAEEKLEKDKFAKFKPVIYKPKYKSLTRTTTPSQESDNIEDEISAKKHFAPSLDQLKRKSFGQTTTEDSAEEDSEDQDKKPVRPSLDKSKYKILRKTTETTIEDESEEEDDKSEKQQLIKSLDKTKVKLFSKTTEADSLELEPEDQSEEHIVTGLDKPKYKLLSRTTTKSPDAEILLNRSIDRSKYSTINRGTTSKYESASLIDNVDLDEEQQDDETDRRPTKYRIYRPTTFHDDEDEDEDENEEDEDTQAPKYRILNPTLTSTVSADIVEDLAKDRILRPTLKESNETVPNINLTLNVSQNESGDKDLNKEKNDTVNTEIQTINSAQNVTAEANKEDAETDSTEESTTNSEESTEEIVTTTTTVRNYINPILTRQKNRPAFVRPRITTQNPLRTVTLNKPKYKSFPRPSSSTTKLQVSKEEDAKNKELERKFVPKGSSRTRFSLIGRENKTEATVSTESTPLVTIELHPSSTEDTSNSTTTEFYNVSLSTATTDNDDTTEPIELTTTIKTGDEVYNSTFLVSNDTSEANVTITELTQETTETSVGNVQVDVKTAENTEEPVGNVVVDVKTTEKTVELQETNVTVNELENTSNATIDQALVSEVTTLTAVEFTTSKSNNEDGSNETTIYYTESITPGSENATTEITPVYHPKSTLRSQQARPKYTVPKRLSPTESSAAKPSQRFNQRNKPQSTRLLTPNLRSTTPSTALKNRFLYKYSTTDRSRFATKETDSELQVDNYDDVPAEDTDVDEEVHEQILTPRPTSGYAPNFPLTRPKPRTSNKPERPGFTKPTDLDNQEEEDEEAKEHAFTPKTSGGYSPSTHPTRTKPRISNRPQGFNFKQPIYAPKVTEEFDDDIHDEVEIDDKVFTPRTPSALPTRSKPRVSNRPEGHTFRKSTEAPKTEDLSDIDTEAVKNRNKNLFAKKRKMNTPFTGPGHSSDETSSSITATTESTTEASLLTTTPVILESVTKPSTQIQETTEYLTTLHHIFAESDSTSENGSSTVEATTASFQENGKVEKLIEVNRIVEVHGMNNTDEQNDKVIDKVGAINRIKSVQIVDNNPSLQENEIAETTSENAATSPKGAKSGSRDPEIATVKEISNSEINGGLFGFIGPLDLSQDRQDRKFEVYGASKVVDYSDKNLQTSGKGNAQIIDGISNINVITPRPYLNTEASTISLEALFQKDTPQKLNVKSNDEELLETGNSRYVNIRILGQDEKVDKEIKDESQIVPVRVLKEDDYITMKAEVVEVTPKSSKDIIKIVPIQVEMSRRLIGPADFNTKVEKGLPKVNFQIVRAE